MNYAAGIDVGPAAGLLIEGVDMAVVSGGMQAFDHGQLQMVGFDALDYRVIVLKSANHFRGWWAPVASEIIDCDAPGVATNDLTTLTYKNKARALYPLDADAAYPESGWRW
jgi:microcystin degradation protein MlrC